MGCYCYPLGAWADGKVLRVFGVQRDFGSFLHNSSQPLSTVFGFTGSFPLCAQAAPRAVGGKPGGVQVRAREKPWSIAFREHRHVNDGMSTFSINTSRDTSGRVSVTITRGFALLM